MFTVIYRWEVRDGCEQRFERAWRSRTDKIAALRGSFGSRLHRDANGVYTAIALWPTREAWANPDPLPDDDTDKQTFAECVISSEPPLLLEDPIDDRWQNGAASLREGYIDLAPGMMANVVTNLEMRARPENNNALATGLHITRLVPVSLERYRALYRRIGEPYLWFSRLRLDDTALDDIINHPDVEVYIAEEGGEDIGLLELDFRVAGDCEVVFFGFIPGATGRGYGRALMDFAIERAWSRPIVRLWLHTCTNDHPSAMTFYKRSGFTPFSTQIEVHADPYADGTLARSGA